MMTKIWCRYDYDGAINITVSENGMQPDVSMTLDNEDARELVALIMRELVLYGQETW